MDIKFNKKNAYLKPLCEVLNVEMHHLLAGSVGGGSSNSSGNTENIEPDNPN